MEKCTITKGEKVMNNIETFGQKVARLRKGKGLTRKQLADKAGITTANVRIIEKDLVKTRIRPSTVVALARSLDVEYEYLED